VSEFLAVLPLEGREEHDDVFFADAALVEDPGVQGCRFIRVPHVEPVADPVVQAQFEGATLLAHAGESATGSVPHVLAVRPRVRPAVGNLGPPGDHAEGVRKGPGVLARQEAELVQCRRRDAGHLVRRAGDRAAAPRRHDGVGVARGDLEHPALDPGSHLVPPPVFAARTAAKAGRRGEGTEHHGDDSHGFSRVQDPASDWPTTGPQRLQW
jgi:hypothetical protein